jgi:cell division septation protein DedD
VEVSTKERLTGALIVVLALVIVAPEMLSGRRAAEQGTPPAQNPEDGAPLQAYRFQLDPANGGAVNGREVAPAAAAEIAAVPPPVPEHTPPVASAPATAPEPAAGAGTRPAAEPQDPKVAAPVKTPASAAAGKWWVQVGSYASRDNAQRKAQKLREGGYGTDVSRMRQNGTELYRVRAGPVADRAAAAALQARLVAAGEKNPTLVAP